VPPVQQPADLDAVRESYDRCADAYVEMDAGSLDAQPWLRAGLAAFAESVRGLGPVLDVGCGPGGVTAHLAGLGLDASGVDLSPRMVEHARRRYPDLRFSVCSATDLDLGPASLGGVLGWWSLFNLPREALPGVLKTFAEALVPGGQALVGTHVGEGDIARTEGYGGHPVNWTTHLYRPEELAGMLADAGLDPVAEVRLPARPGRRARRCCSPRGARPDPSGQAAGRVARCRRATTTPSTTTSARPPTDSRNGSDPGSAPCAPTATSAVSPGAMPMTVPIA
jgi:SAM-dependent methyltransferase